MSRSQRIDSEELIDIGPVLNHAYPLRGMVFDSCCVDPLVWTRMKTSKPDASEYDEVVRLVSRYRKIAETAPEGATSVVFEHDSWGPMVLGGREIDWDKEKWLCKVTTSIEDGLRCMTFEEVIDG